MPISRHEFQIFADYHQFYLEDENAPHNIIDVWDDQAHERMLGIDEGLIAVGTARNMTVPVRIEIHDCEPFLEAENFSRVNECVLKVVSNKLVLSGCTDYPPDAARIEIEPHTYRVRVIYGNLETVREEWEGEDFYILQLWKSSESGDVSTVVS